ncbi:hypothetical protein TNCV_1958431 [Trichonephila clavipes]|nr:hypothetical protein TNCV_1958431 [Trichonephila clavipes]
MAGHHGKEDSRTHDSIGIEFTVMSLTMLIVAFNFLERYPDLRNFLSYYHSRIGSLVIEVTDSRPAHHKFEPSTAKDTR